MLTEFSPGDQVVLKSTGELVEVVHQDGANVLVKRPTGTQWTHNVGDLMQFGVCPIR